MESLMKVCPSARSIEGISGSILSTGGLAADSPFFLFASHWRRREKHYLDGERKEKREMKRMIWIVMMVFLFFLLADCKTTSSQSGYNPTFEKMREGKWGGGW